MIEPRDLPGVDETTAWRLIAAARSFAPTLDSLEDSKRDQAIAILKGAAAEMPAAGASRIRSMSRNGTSTTLADFKSAFSADDINALRALCSDGDVGTGGGRPVGSFPEPGIVGRLWPEGHGW